MSLALKIEGAATRYCSPQGLIADGIIARLEDVNHLRLEELMLLRLRDGRVAQIRWQHYFWRGGIDGWVDVDEEDYDPATHLLVSESDWVRGANFVSDAEARRLIGAARIEIIHMDEIKEAA